MSLKDDWKDAGKGIGKSFAGLGKSIIKSVKVGVDRVTEDENAEKVESESKTSLREDWSAVGHSFGRAGKSLGKAAAGTVKKVADAIDEDEKSGEEKPGENSGNKKENTAKDKSEEGPV